jgi:hypothetical protein
VLIPTSTTSRRVVKVVVVDSHEALAQLLGDDGGMLGLRPQSICGSFSSTTPGRRLARSLTSVTIVAREFRGKSAHGGARPAPSESVASLSELEETSMRAGYRSRRALGAMGGMQADRTWRSSMIPPHCCAREGGCLPMRETAG